MQNLEIVCYLKSPLCQDPPMFDSLLGWIQGIRQGSFANRNMELHELPELNIPLEKESHKYGWFYKCSNPIYNIEFEWQERWSKRLDIERVALIVKNSPKNISTGSGAYKMRYSPLLCRQIDFIKWFCVGDRIEIEDILKDINALGNKRSIGYGFVKFWEVKKADKDYSIFYEIDKKKYLIKSIPVGYYREHEDWGLQNINKEYGSCKMPYWHPENYEELIVPC